MAKFVGLVGDPVAHSLSPAMHRAAFRALHLDWTYLGFAVKAADLAPAVQGLWALGCQGFNVTIPHKQAVIPLMAELSPEASAIQAVNTVIRTPLGWRGENTDLAGFMGPLAPVSKGACLVLGTGGAARSALVGALHLGYQPVYVLGRNLQVLQDLAHRFGIVALDQTSPKILATCALVVNATPLGMQGYVFADQAPLTLQELSLLPPACSVYDLVYTPALTPLIRIAQDLGLKTLGGLEMLMGQGARALEYWTGLTAPRAVMLQELHHQLFSPAKMDPTAPDVAGP